NIYYEFYSSRSAALTAYDKIIEGSKITHPVMRHASRSPTKGPSKSLKNRLKKRTIATSQREYPMRFPNFTYFATLDLLCFKSVDVDCWFRK
ncbi:MAG: hypothetical protein VYC14_08585, partial [Actinomycetota bacterium]|nr:hypothetical protein [Actinomycetota bacterium]